MSKISRRTFFRYASQTAAAATVSQFLVAEAFAQQKSNAKYEAAFRALDAYVERYMREMNSPGMTVAIADKAGVARVATYGFSDVELKDRVRPEQLFHIGSITKSFAAFVILQLADEKKIDLQRPVMEYLPWLPIAPKWPFTAHHLLTHSAGLPSIGELFLTDPAMKYEQGFEPGKAFHYCNMGYGILGALIEKFDGRPWGESVRERVFKPLGMASSFGMIDNEIRARTAKNYSPFRDDVPYPRYGLLAQAANFIYERASGSIASTPEDMGRYMRAIINQGAIGGGAKIASPQGFALFGTPHILAEEFGPKVHYGYGIAVDSLDGHKVLRHTGGMVSFMSAMQIDIDGGFGAFASINAQQGYRPNPVAQYALKLMRASVESKQLPAAPEPNDPMRIKNAADYVGEYTGTEGQKLVVVMREGRLIADDMGYSFELQQTGTPDQFIALGKVPTYFPLVFGRAKQDDAKSPVVEAAYGPHWYTNAKYSGPRQFTAPDPYQQYVGHYRNDEPWTASTRVVLRKGKLWLDGVLPLEQDEQVPNLFHFRDEPTNPEVVRFLHVVDGKAQMIKISGTDLWRMAAR
jgi:CubicO group peptidase (beta-lactamase class C family)